MTHPTQEPKPEHVLIEQRKVKSAQKITCKALGRKIQAELIIYTDGGVDVTCERRDYCTPCKHERP